jgi:hypothetical protein
MKTISEMHKDIRVLADKAFTIFKSNDHKTSPEYRKIRKEVDNIVNNIDPDLVARFRATQKWVDQNHPIVGSNSTWSNCTGKEDIMLEYLGFSEYRCDRLRSNDEFKKSDVSSKQILIDGFKYYQARLDKERDILSAGDIDTSSTDMMEEAIKTMLLSLNAYDEDLVLL